MNIYIIIILTIFILFIIFLYLLKNKINLLEQKIIIQFKEKTNQIPGIYESSKEYLTKHNDIFKEILILKKKDFSENLFSNNLLEKINTYKLIHNELDFILRICNNNPKIKKDYKYNFIKNNIIDKSEELGNNILLYKKIVKKYNFLITIKNITIIGLFIPINSIISI